MQTLKQQLEGLFIKHGKTPEGIAILGELMDILTLGVIILRPANIVAESQVDNALREFSDVWVEKLNELDIFALGNLHLKDKPKDNEE